MTSITVFEKVAAGEFTAEQGAKLMLESDRRARLAARPAWVPKVAWLVATTAACALLALLGIRQDS
jgi:hypothetical protein